MEFMGVQDVVFDLSFVRYVFSLVAFGETQIFAIRRNIGHLDCAAWNLAFHLD